MSSVRHQPMQISEIPKTSRICASAPHTGRSSAGTNSDSGVRSRASQNGSTALTDPRSWTGWKPHEVCCTIWKTAVRQTAPRVIGIARHLSRTSASRTVR